MVTYFFVVVIDVTELSRKDLLGKLLYADDLVLVSQTIEKLRKTSIKLTQAFESKSLKVDIRKTKVMVSGGSRKDGITKSKVNTCGICSLRVKANSVLCAQCGN